MTHSSSSLLLPLALSVGDPAGIGPDIAASAALRCAKNDRIVLYGDASHLVVAIKKHGGCAHVLSSSANLTNLQDTTPLSANTVSIVHVTSWDSAMVQAHAPTPEGGRAQLAALDAAIHAVTTKQARAIVTGPTSKEAIEMSGVHFTGQTEHLARAVGLPKDAVTMMFLGPRLNAALVTTHLAIADVPNAITMPRIERTLRHLAAALRQLATNSSNTRITLHVCGLNPHAGEAGLFGREDIDHIAPVVAQLQQDPAFKHIKLRGPGPAEAIFRQVAAHSAHSQTQHAHSAKDTQNAKELHGVVAMYHDQATIPSKLLDWGNAVNVTWGLPFLRTSVDHGVAYDAAKAGTAEDNGMVAAIQLAQQLTRHTL